MALFQKLEDIDGRSLDAQTKSLTSEASTTSNVYEEIPDCKFTTANLSSSGVYVILFKGRFNHTRRKAESQIRLLHNGIILPETTITYRSDINNEAFNQTLSGSVLGVASSDRLHLEWRTDRGVLSLSDMSFTVIGIPTTMLV